MARLAARLDLLVLQLCRAGVIVRKKWIDDDDETAGRRTDDFVNHATRRNLGATHGIGTIVIFLLWHWNSSDR